jgi:hypothetical protein
MSLADSEAGARVCKMLRVHMQTATDGPEGAVPRVGLGHDCLVAIAVLRPPAGAAIDAIVPLAGAARLHSAREAIMAAGVAA